MIGNGGKLSGQGLVDRAILHIDSYLGCWINTSRPMALVLCDEVCDQLHYQTDSSTVLLLEQWAWQDKIATHICVCSHVEESQHIHIHMSLGRPTTVHAITEDWCNICILALHSHH